MFDFYSINVGALHWNQFIYTLYASLNNWHLLRQQRQPMAHDTKLHNSDDSAVFASRCGRR
ncbi:hypothetical protein ACGI06_26250, partial [Escherichia coli]